MVRSLVAFLAIARCVHATDYVYKYDATTSCTAANIHSVTIYKAGLCYTPTGASGSRKYSCTSDVAKIMTYTSTDCSGTADSTVTYSIPGVGTTIGTKAQCATMWGAGTKAWFSCTMESLPASANGYAITAQFASSASACNKAAYAVSPYQIFTIYKTEVCRQTSTSVYQKSTTSGLSAGKVFKSYYSCTNSACSAGCGTGSEAVAGCFAIAGSGKYFSNLVKNKAITSIDDALTGVTGGTGGTGANSAPHMAAPSMMILVCAWAMTGLKTFSQ